MNKGFTLIEMVIVFAIVVILAVTINLAFQERALIEKCNKELFGVSSLECKKLRAKKANKNIDCIGGYLFNKNTGAQIINEKGVGISCNGGK